MDLKMEAGKLGAQCSHAAVDAVLRSPREKVVAWQQEGGKKVVLKVDGLKMLLAYETKAKALKLKTALITDAGKTFFTEPTITCLAIGPDSEKKIDAVTGQLKIL